MRICSRAANFIIREPQCYRLLDYILRSGCSDGKGSHEIFSACIAMEESGIVLRCATMYGGVLPVCPEPTFYSVLPIGVIKWRRE
jgi:hypothetical protein